MIFGFSPTFLKAFGLLDQDGLKEFLGPVILLPLAILEDLLVLKLHVEGVEIMFLLGRCLVLLRGAHSRPSSGGCALLAICTMR